MCFNLILVMIPKNVSESHSPHMIKTIPTQHRKRRPEESTNLVPTEDPPKVKLENFHNSRVPELG